MEFLPINIDLRGKPCLIVGGGDVAWRKVKTLKKAGAVVTVVAPQIDPYIDGVIKIEREFEPADVQNAFMVVSATSDKSVNRLVAETARSNGALVNCADDPANSDFIFPGIIDRSPLLISVSTSGHAPHVSKTIRMELEKKYGAEFSKKVLDAGSNRGSKLIRGKVYLVGSGPGDPGLLTIRAKELIESADVLLHDYYVCPDIVGLARKDAEIISVAKRGFNTSFRQGEIHELLVKYAKDGRLVVRLKGGDSWIFARGAEEAEYLAENNIEFEIVPGVTSALAVPTYAGIPISHRKHSSSIAIATGHPSDGKDFEDIDVPSADTIIYLMGVSNLEKIASRLIQSGKPADLPAAMIENGTLGKQRAVYGTLSTISEIAGRSNIEPPSIFICGNAVGARHNLDWFDRLPLFGKKIIITRPIGQSAETIYKLRRFGAEVVHLPTIEINVADEGECFFRNPAPLSGFTDIIFTSENGASIFFGHMSANGLDSRSLAGKEIYAIGPSTALAVKKHGIIPVIPDNNYTSEDLASILKDNLQGRYFLLPRADKASNVIETVIEKRGGKFEKLTLYNIGTPAMKEKDLNGTDGIVFTSSLTASNFLNNYNWPCGAKAFCIGQRTASVFDGKDIETVVSERATVDDLVDSLVQYFKDKK